MHTPDMHDELDDDRPPSPPPPLQESTSVLPLSPEKTSQTPGKSGKKGSSPGKQGYKGAVEQGSGTSGAPSQSHPSAGLRDVQSRLQQVEHQVRDLVLADGSLAYLLAGVLGDEHTGCARKLLAHPLFPSLPLPDL